LSKHWQISLVSVIVVTKQETKIVDIDIRYKPSFATIFLTLEPGESIIAESGAMIAMDAALTMKTEFNGGFLSGVLKKFFGGESLFVNRFTNPTRQSLQVVLSQSTIGDIAEAQVYENNLCFQPGAYIASTPRYQIRRALGWIGKLVFGRRLI
jgi:uncharacterized protein (TIGR00266 family)